MRLAVHLEDGGASGRWKMHIFLDINVCCLETFVSAQRKRPISVLILHPTDQRYVPGTAVHKWISAVLQPSGVCKAVDIYQRYLVFCKRRQSTSTSEYQPFQLQHPI